LHPKPSLNAKRAKHQETKAPNLNKQSAKHKENRAAHTNLMKQGT